jgi:DNA-binding beta-propeller fold protein YncE
MRSVVLAVLLVVAAAAVAAQAAAPAAEQAPPGLPDLDVTCIGRTPRYPAYDLDYPQEGEMQGIAQLKPGTEKTKRWPDEGEEVTFTASVVNKGTAAAPKFAYVWKLDGKEIGRGTMGPVKPGATATATTTWAWTLRRHTIEFVADPDNAVAETFEINNARKEYTDALVLLMGVHRTTYESFNASANVTGTHSFEDWVQFHVDYMNMLFERSRSPLAPRGMLDRIRAEGFVVVKDDKERDAIWAGEAPWCTVKGNPLQQGFDGAWYFGERADCAAWAAEPDWGLIHEWGHQLGIIDNYQLNVECWGDTVRELDGRRIRIGHDFADQEVMMHWHGPNLFYEGTVLGMNAQQHRRRGYFGDYLYAIPEKNIVRVLDRTGAPVPLAGVKVYQWTKFDRGAGTRMSPEPIATGTTDENGEFVLPNQPCPTFTTDQGFTLHPNPFGRINVVGLNGLLLLRLHARRQTDYVWMEIFDFNRQFHMGNRAVATYEIATELPEHSAPVCEVELKGTTKGRTVELEWKYARSHDIVSYNVYRGISADYHYEQVASNLHDLKWTDNLMQINPYFSKTYRYVVTAVNAHNKESAFSTSYTTPILNDVHGVAVDSKDRRIVADAFYFHVLALEPDGSWAFLSDTFWGGHGVTERVGAQLLPEDVAVDSADRIIALNAPDPWNALAGFTIFDSDGGWIKTVGAAPAGGDDAPEGEDDALDGEGEFVGPKGIAVGPGDVIVVADTGNNRVQVFDKDGAFLRLFGTRGDGEGQFKSPEGVGVAPDGTIYVADTGNNRVQLFTLDGAFVAVLRDYAMVSKAVEGTPTGELEKQYSDLPLQAPCDVHVGRDGTLYVAQAGNNTILVVPQGDMTKKWSFNAADGNLSKPAGVTVDSKGNIIIADSGNKRVAVYKAEDRQDLKP